MKKISTTKSSFQGRKIWKNKFLNFCEIPKKFMRNRIKAPFDPFFGPYIMDLHHMSSE